VRAAASRSKLRPSRPDAGWARYGQASARTAFWTLVRAFARNNLLTYASAIAFQVLIAAVAVALLGLALLDLLSLEEVWGSTVQPFFESRLLSETSRAVDKTVEKIFESGGLALLVFASLLALWEVSGAVRAIMGALNEIYESDETRSLVRRFATSFALSTALIVCIGGAVSAVTLLPRLDEIPNGLALGIGWIAAIALLGAAVWLLLRYAPCATRSAGWTSLGSAFVIVAWIGASLLFGFYVRSVASYTSAIGNLVAFLTLTAYLYTSSIIFLTGAQIDELLRRRAQRNSPASTR
jgi:membrane protein